MLLLAVGFNCVLSRVHVCIVSATMFVVVIVVGAVILRTVYIFTLLRQITW